MRAIVITRPGPPEVLEPRDVPDPLCSHDEILVPGGRMILVGLLGGRRAEVDLGTILRRRLTLIGTALRPRSLEEKAAVTQEFGRHGVPLLACGRVQPVVDRVFPLAEAAAAHAYMETNRHFGKIVLRVD